MKPYYQEAGVTIYHGDCRDVLPYVSVDLTCTDPPYNCGKDYGGWNDSLPDSEYEEIMLQIAALARSAAANQFWVAPRYKLHFWMGALPGSHLVVIRRGAQGPGRAGWGDQFEIALAIGRPHAQIPDLWEGIRLKGEGYFFRENHYGHPGYTPEPIMRRAIKALCNKSVVDPFSGTGTTLIAARALGKQAVGIELNEAYCELAARRLSQGVFDLQEVPA